MTRARHCPRTAYLRRMIEQGRVVAAKQQAVTWLQEAYASPQFLGLIAELLDPVRPDRIRRSRRPPAQWLDIGEAFHAIREDGFTRDQTILILTDRFHRSARLIDKALAFYRVAHRASRPPPGGADRRADVAVER